MDWNEVLSRVLDAVASLGDNLFNFVTLVVSIAAIVVAARANHFAKKANDIAASSIDLARKANDIALSANDLVKEANDIQVQALEHTCNQDMINNFKEAKRKSGDAAS